jgi:hypothetical protein
VAGSDQTQRGVSRARDAMRRHEVLASGIITGIAGGMVMLAVAMFGARSEELETTHALQVIGESFVGPEALDGATKIAFGALVHLTTSVAFGILLASIVPRDFPMASAIGVGVGFALFALMFMMPVVVPWANPGFRRGMQDIGGTWVLAHALFGATLGMSPALRRWFVHAASGASAQTTAQASPRAGPVTSRTRAM